MIISLIVAVGKNNVIGTEGKLPWRLPADLKHFKKLTEGHSIIMGRKTHESIGRALPGRRNIVITRNPDFRADGIEVAHSLEEAIKMSKAAFDTEVFVIGGGEIYKMAMPLADRIYFSRVHTSVAGDAFFPEIDLAEWAETSRETHQSDEKNQYPYSFIVYERSV